MSLKDIFWGKIDAKNELLDNSPSKIDAFFNSFCNPPNINLNDYIDGRRYIIAGLKGLGKTAFLRYISIALQRKRKAMVSFILFKESFDVAEKKNLVNVTEIDASIDEKTAVTFDNDFEIALRWFLYNYLIKQSSITNPFREDSNYHNFVKTITQRGTPFLKSLIPHIGDMFIHDNKLNTDIKFLANDKSKLIEIVKDADAYFEKLSPQSGNSLYIFCDEIEFGIGNAKQRRRDAEIIRDFIVTICRLNERLRANNIDCLFYIAIRSEVLSKVDCIGKEVNKLLDDWGKEIKWAQAGHDERSQPLLKIITLRLREYERSREITTPESLIFKKYFPETIAGKTTQEYILHGSWYRPRDIVRMLNMVQDAQPSGKQFIESAFLSIKKDYSKACWIENSEEMITGFGKDIVDQLPIIFRGLPYIFDLQVLIRHINSKSDIYPKLKSISGKIPEILQQLFFLGIIGNTSLNREIRLAYRGDTDLALDEKMFVHVALRPFLNTTVPEHYTEEDDW